MRLVKITFLIIYTIVLCICTFNFLADAIYNDGVYGILVCFALALCITTITYCWLEK